MTKNFFFRQLSFTFALFLVLAFTSVISAETLQIGQSLPLKGDLEKKAKEFNKGSLAWIKYLNSRGGLNGKNIELITKNDAGSAENAEKISQDFISENYLLLYGYMGFESCIKSYEISKKSEVPFFGASTGAIELHKFSENNAFFIRPDYGSEAENMINILLENNKNKISFFHSDSKWAESFTKGAKWSFEEKNLKMFSTASVSSNSPDIKSAAEKINSGIPEAVIIASEPEIASSFIKEIRKLNPSIIIIAAADVDGNKLSGLLMNQGVGVVVSQVVPFPFNTKYQITRLYKRLSSEYFPEQALSFSGFEGFISARALTTILSKCSEPVTRENFIKTARDMAAVNLGGFVFDFSKNKSTGSINSYFTQIGPGGFLTPISSLDDIYKYSPL
jgi:ABC-type branched-subunit amino acid transport system substrate-binding protein